jgi:hypothetical protein
MTIEGSVTETFGDVPAGLGIAADAPVFLELTYDSAAADSYDLSADRSAAFYMAPNPAFSLVAIIGTTSYSWVGEEWEAQVDVSDEGTFERYGFAISDLGANPIILFGILDETAPFDLLDGLSIHQIPDLSAATSHQGMIEDDAGQWGALFAADVITLEVVPEPQTALLVAFGLGVLAATTRSRPKRSRL